ncbi:MAG: hypothetical protein HY782_06580 [Chloroflexi bacterium]|nr:hypothetical protein [Chloroflexota bacterium]
MSAITIEKGTVKIPIEAVEGDGWVVLTLAPNAYLILRADKISNYPAEKLDQLRRAVSALSGEPEPNPRYHPSKVRALREMRAAGIPVSGGEEYFPNPVENPPSLEQVRRGLASIKGSLSDLVIALREEEG